MENPKPDFYLIVLLGEEELPVSVEIKVILGYNMLNLSRAICLGYACLKVKPVVGGCFRYCDSAFIAIFSAKFT